MEVKAHLPMNSVHMNVKKLILNGSERTRRKRRHSLPRRSPFKLILNGSESS